MSGPGDARALEQALQTLLTVRYDLTLYVSGASPLSARAVGNARAVCEAHLQGRYALTVVDVRSDPGLVVSAGIVAVPTLVREAPLPRRLVVGDLSDTPRVLRALDLPLLDSGHRT